MSIPWLNPEYPELFPPIESAQEEPNGLLALGGDLSPKRLIAAYKQGIFPWYERYLEDGSPSPIFWWSPQPRCVLELNALKVSRSLIKSMRNKGYSLSCDFDFRATISACAHTRETAHQEPFDEPSARTPTDNTLSEHLSGTWIDTDMIEAYCRLHELGHAHSVECWAEQQLVGGLYGVSIGTMFFGESMFSIKTDASKIALAYLCQILSEQDVQFIDCQMDNPHLASLGASNMDIDEFKGYLNQEIKKRLFYFPLKE